jgi:hypothetical protein
MGGNNCPAFTFRACSRGPKLVFDGGLSLLVGAVPRIQTGSNRRDASPVFPTASDARSVPPTSGSRLNAPHGGSVHRAGCASSYAQRFRDDTA